MQPAQRGPTQRSSKRNLFAFRDGTGSPEVTNAELMNRLVWVQSGARGEPSWTADGTYIVARAIRKGDRIPLDAHIRLANPRTDATAHQRILRRGYNYHRGIDEAGDLDQGLMFVAFSQDPKRQFATIQNRLSAEPMVDYITPVGGGYFFAPRGARGQADWVRSGLAV